MSACFFGTYFSTAHGPLPFRITPKDVPNANINKLNDIDLSFYNQVWMQSYFHAGSYFIGLVMATVYNRYRFEKNARGEVPDISRSMRLLA